MCEEGKLAIIGMESVCHSLMLNSWLLADPKPQNSEEIRDIVDCQMKEDSDIQGNRGEQIYIRSVEIMMA